VRRGLRAPFARDLSDPRVQVKPAPRRAVNNAVGRSPTAGDASNGVERPPTETTVRTSSVLGHGPNSRDVTVVGWPGPPGVM
jgi:hypothetical protein